VGYLYCDVDETVVTWNTYDPIYSKLIDNKNPWALNEEEQARVERALKPCPCGGRFAFKNPPRCPMCREDISAVVEGGIYYVVAGRRIDGDNDDVWA
jgi:hypothetical protein